MLAAITETLVDLKIRLDNNSAAGLFWHNKNLQSHYLMEYQRSTVDLESIYIFCIVLAN